MRTGPRLAYRLRGMLMVPPFLFVLFVFYGETEWDSVIWPLGLGLFAAGVFVRIWAQMHLHYRLRLRKQLTLTGPYAYLRNPIYVGNTAILLGVTVLSELLWFVPLMLLWCILVYGAVVRCEEEHLKGKYGDPYRAYLERVPRWWPRGLAPSAAPAGTRQLLWKSVAAEAHCLLWVVPMIAKELFSTAL